MSRVFEKSFTQQEPIPEAAIARAVQVMRSGRLHRYNTMEGETSEVSLLEAEFASYLGVPYCLACASGGYALHVALRSAGLAPGDGVLCNAFTLSPVPGAIHNAGGRPILVEITEDYTIDTRDLEQKAADSEARFLLLSHMRGHIGDMDTIVDLCTENGIVLIEDCAHTMGARWNGRMSGTFGAVACFSTQTYKHLNSGEGGLLTTEDPEYMARAVIHSGSYMLYERHGAVPDSETFERVRLVTPNYSGRMDNLRAAILHEQLRGLDERCRRWNTLYGVLEARLTEVPGLRMPVRPQHEEFVGSSIQFSLPELGDTQIRRLLGRCAERGVDLKWFGDPVPHAFTSRFDSWRYIDPMIELPATLRILATLLDMRIPLTFDEQDCELIASIVDECVREVR